MADQERFLCNELIFRDPAGGIPQSLSKLLLERPAVTLANAAGVTLTAAQVLAGKLVRSGAAGVSDTLPTAQQLFDYLGGKIQIGQAIKLQIVNLNTGTLTIVTGTGITLVGVTTCITVALREYELKCTATQTPAFTFTGIHSFGGAQIA